MIYYVGGFPPPYGGVTVKNSLLADALEQKYPLRRLDASRSKRNPLILLGNLARILTCRDTLILATAGSARRRLVMLLKRLRPKLLERTLVIVMGGTFPSAVEDDYAYIAALKRCKQLFVETASMAKKLEALGIANVSVYPNCRPDFRVSGIRPTGQQLKCLFFSLITPDKGVDLILTAAAATPEIEYHFYGHIAPGYEEAFRSGVASAPNCRYHGVFPGNDPGLYALLNSYDVLLLPTRWFAEGVPGILVESKLAALPAVVSDMAYNREVVEHGVAGMVLSDYTANELAATVRTLADNPAQTDALKAGALRSAQEYLIESHLSKITNYLR